VTWEFKMVKGGPYTAEPGTRVNRFETHVAHRDWTLGIRLVHSGEPQAYRDKQGFTTPPAFWNNNLGFRVARNRE
jgi:hypothetical protein